MQIKALLITLFSSLALANPLGAGQKRKIWEIQESARLLITLRNVGACSPTRTYVISGGDTFRSIADIFDTGVCDIAKANNISNVNLIMVGQMLNIPTRCNPKDNISCLR